MLHLPAEFIGLAEETGDILPIGRWVIAEGCRRVRALAGAATSMPGLRLYVNLSARQFRDPGLVPMITAALAETGLPAPRPDPRDHRGHAARRPASRPSSGSASCARSGCASRSTTSAPATRRSATCARSTIDELKIDRSFVPGASGVGDAKVLSQAIVELGRMLALEMVAEGIETAGAGGVVPRRSAAASRRATCSRHPMPAAELDRYFRRQSQSMRRSTQTAVSEPMTVSPTTT